MELDWAHFWYQAWHLLLAFALAIPIGWDREREVRSAGLRTFPLVAVATCGFVLVGMASFDGEDARARVIYGTITGLGFLGGGAILKASDDQSIHGMTTAASLWSTGAIGVAVAADQLAIAILLAALNLFLLRLKHWLPAEVRKDDGEG